MQKRLKPASPGLKVAFAGRPGTYLAEVGEVVPLSSYWTRRIISGDVVEVREARASEPETKTKTATAPTRRKLSK